MSLITRRLFARCSTSWLLAGALRPSEAQSRAAADSDLPVRLVKEIKYAQLLDVSPDGKKLLMYFTRHPVESFVYRGSWQNTTPRDGEDALRVVEVGSWKSVYATRLPRRPHDGSFSGDGGTVYVTVVSFAHLTVDLLTGKKNEQPYEPYERNALSWQYFALEGGVLLGAGVRSGHIEVLVRAELSSYKELLRVPFAETRILPTYRRWEAPIAVSADRKWFVTAYDDQVVCRRAGDLGTVWASQFDLPAKVSLRRAAISADGRLVAVSASMAQVPIQRYSTAVFDGEDGRQILRLPVDGSEAIGISPDAKLLAAGMCDYVGGCIHPTVHLFEIPSGRQVATLVHDKFGDVERDHLIAGFQRYGVQFTPDGKYLITSGLNTKVWEIGRR